MRVYARTPLDLDKVIIPQGQIYLIPERCKGCQVCVRFCPQNILCISEERNVKGYRIPMVSNDVETECVNCEFCTLVCPEFAIFTLPLEGEPNA